MQCRFLLSGENGHGEDPLRLLWRSFRSQPQAQESDRVQKDSVSEGEEGGLAKTQDADRPRLRVQSETEPATMVGR